jgi:superfamily I DNA/RNA helicase
MLKRSDTVRRNLRQQFEYVLIDEYQDTNSVQYALIKLILNEQRNICVVGDDAQSIYSFRGADFTNILNFERDYPGAEIVKLEQNYRSTGHILEAVEAKVKATQDAEKARRDLDRVKYEAEQKIIQAQAQAKAFEIQASAMKARGGDTYLRYEAIRKWDGKLPLYTGGSNPPIVQMVR